MLIALIESSPREWMTGRARTVMGRACRGAGIDPEFVSEDRADVLVYLFNWEDGDWLIKQRLGRSIPLKKARGYIFRDEVTGKIIVPTYHPRLVGRGSMHLLPLLVWDLTLAVSLPGLPEFPTTDLILAPSPDEFRNFLGETVSKPVDDWIVVDLETHGSMGDEEDLENPGMQIVRASLSRPDCRAITFPWQEPFVGIFKEHVEFGQTLVGWNCHDFDWPRLREAGFNLDLCKLVDVMWLWKYLQPRLPRGLGAVSTLYDWVPEWKSLSSTDEELYSAMDARQTAKIYLGIRRALESRG